MQVAYSWRRFAGGDRERAPGAAATEGPRRIGERYDLINELGHGGMSSVYRVLDRLTGRVVTLKKLHARLGSGPNSEVEDRVLLAQEFQFLASLRHPNIITVLDYGFDAEGEPYFTMDLRESARTIVEAGAEQPLSVQVELLVQTLRALAYLHRHGIVHRDLKPENVLVVDGQVKVLDLGLSILAGAGAGRTDELTGTLPYMAPEMLRGEPVSPQSDLYAVGTMALELLSGRYPFPIDDVFRLQQQICETALPRPEDEVDERLEPILRRLLAKRPADRYADASDVIEALAEALRERLQVETVSTRESFLQAAPFVGREVELAGLEERLRDAVRGKGGAWLLTGESGAGKSRLIEELRIRALVQGFVAVRGQARGEGGEPYHAWREALRGLVIRCDLPDSEAGALKDIVPELPALLGREIPDPPELDSEAAQSRLLFAAEELLRRQPRPVLIVVEDLHWVGSESLQLWSWLARAVERLPVLMVGSCRMDEAPELPERLDCTQSLLLRRLDPGEVKRLTEAIIGPEGSRDELVELIDRETEGNPFFIVEVVRALAERAGQLSQIGASLPAERVFPGGLRRVVQRRLSQVPKEAYPGLETAAVIGREISEDLLQSLHPELELDHWTQRCEAAAVLEFRDHRWHFAHDKLRERLLGDLRERGAGAWTGRHRRVAEAMEQLRPERVTALAYHWREAGDLERESRYAQQAGMLALQSGAYLEAIGFLTRSLELLQPAAGELPRAHRSWRLDPSARVDPESSAFRLGSIEGALAEARFRAGHLPESRRHLQRALWHLGDELPRSRPGWLLVVLREATRRAAQVAIGVRARDLERSRRVAAVAAPVQRLLTESYFYSLEALPIVWSSLRLVNRCEPTGPSALLAQGYALLGVVASVVPLPRLADHWSQRALVIAEQSGSEREVALVLSRIGVINLQRCRWHEASTALQRASAIAERVGDARLWEESRVQHIAVQSYSGEFSRCLEPLSETLRLSRRRGNRQMEVWSQFLAADVLLYLGREREALERYEDGLALLDEKAMRVDAIWALGMLALARLRLGDPAGARASAELALGHILGVRPVAFWLRQGAAATAEVFLALLEAAGSSVELLGSARQACAALGRYATGFLLGRAQAELWAGLLAQLESHPRRAMRHWSRSLRWAEQLHMPYELGRTHLEIGRHAEPGTPARRDHLERAASIFEELGCATDLARANRELEGGG